MKKIPTLFVREFNNHKIIGIKPEFTNERCKQAFLYGLITVKWDGSCCAIINGQLYKRYDAKGKTIPANAILCQEEPDPITGHFPCWVKCDVNNPADKWFFDAKNTRIEENGDYEPLEDGTYEAIGKNFQGNPYNLTKNILVKHGVNTLELLERNFDYVKEFLKNTNIEGLVFWLAGEPVCKIKRSDFGFEWNNTKRK